MNFVELIDHIESGHPKTLTLDGPLRFRRRTRATRAHPVDLNDLLQALRSNVTIQKVTCKSHAVLDVTESEWERILRAIGGMQALVRLRVHWRNGAQDFYPLQAVARALDVTKALHYLYISSWETNTASDSTGAAVLAASLQQNATLLTHFVWRSATRRANNQDIFHAAAALPRLQEATIWDNCTDFQADCIRALVRSPSIGSLNLRLRLKHWGTVAEEIRSGGCKLETLSLIANRNLNLRAGTTSTNIIQAVATSLEHNTSLRSLKLYLWSGFSDEAVVALAKALTVNTKLRSLELQLYYVGVDKAWAQTRQEQVQVHGCEAYKALGEMLTSKKEPLKLKFPLPQGDRSPETFKQRKLYCIELILNGVGRASLVAASPAPKEAWVRALDKVNSRFADFGEATRADFHLNCVFTLLQLNPSICPVSKTLNVLSDRENQE